MFGGGIATSLTSLLLVAWQTVWQDLEVENEMSRGLLPGLVVLSGKLAPTLRATTQRTLHSVAQVLPDLQHPTDLQIGVWIADQSPADNLPAES